MYLGRVFSHAAIGAALLVMAPLASAAIIVTPGVDNTDTDNVIANAACAPS